MIADEQEEEERKETYDITAAFDVNSQTNK